MKYDSFHNLYSQEASFTLTLFWKLLLQVPVEQRQTETENCCYTRYPYGWIQLIMSQLLLLHFNPLADCVNEDGCKCPPFKSAFYVFSVILMSRLNYESPWKAVMLRWWLFLEEHLLCSGFPPMLNLHLLPSRSGPLVSLHDNSEAFLSPAALVNGTQTKTSWDFPIIVLPTEVMALMLQDE